MGQSVKYHQCCWQWVRLVQLILRWTNKKSSKTGGPCHSHRRFPFSPKFWKFWLEIKWNGPFWFGPSRSFGITLKVVPSAALLYPAYKCNNNRTVAWVSSVQPECMFHWACGISEISDWHFCWMESAHTCKQCDHYSVSTLFPGILSNLSSVSLTPGDIRRGPWEQDCGLTNETSTSSWQDGKLLYFILMQ